MAEFLPNSQKSAKAELRDQTISFNRPVLLSNSNLSDCYEFRNFYFFENFHVKLFCLALDSNFEVKFLHCYGSIYYCFRTGHC